MFTGIIESTGIIREISNNSSNRSFWVESPLSHELKVDQSLSHNGVCLTIEEIRDNLYRVTAIKETLEKTTMSSWAVGDKINLERCLKLDGRLDGHIVQGHVDATATCIKKVSKNGSWEFTFEFPKKFAELVIEKGSITVNGISLTAFDVSKKSFRVAIIPYTYEHTNIKDVEEDMDVNLEFDMIGKYILRRVSLKD